MARKHSLTYVPMWKRRVRAAKRKRLEAEIKRNRALAKRDAKFLEVRKDVVTALSKMMLDGKEE